MTAAEKRAISSSLRLMALIRSEKSNMESRRNPADPSDVELSFLNIFPFANNIRLFLLSNSGAK